MRKANIKNLRQGQTVYIICGDFNDSTKEVDLIVQRYMLYSQKQKLPKLGCVIEKMPINHLKNILKVFKGTKHIYYSRRKAYKALKALN